MANIENSGLNAGHDRNTLARMIDTGHAAEALAALDRDPSPADWRHHYLRGSALAALRRAPEAFNELQIALTYSPNSPGPYAKMAHLSMAEREFELALNNAQRATSLAGETEEMTELIALALLELGRLVESRAVAASLVAKWPQSRRAHSVEGAIMKADGRIGEAEECFHRALSVDPESAETAYELFTLVSLNEGDPVVARMRDIHRSGVSSDQRSRIYLEYALGVAEEKLGNHDEAFAHFLNGSAMIRSNVSYDEAGIVSLFERIKSTFQPETLKPRLPPPSTSAVPIFILGMPRSGTTLVEQIVASHHSVSGGGETTEFLRAVGRVENERGGKFPEFVPELPVRWLERIANLYLNRFVARFPEAPRITDKTPANYLALGLIRLLFPNAAIVHCRRDPLDNCISMFTHLFTEDQPYTYELAELGRYYKLYASLMSHWRTVLPEGSFLDVDYEDLIANPEATARKIITHCGLEWDPNCLEFFRTERPVLTASAAQVRRPIYQDSKGRAGRFSRFLSPLREALV